MRRKQLYKYSNHICIKAVSISIQNDTTCLKTFITKQKYINFAIDKYKIADYTEWPWAI